MFQIKILSGVHPHKDKIFKKIVIRGKTAHTDFNKTFNRYPPARQQG